MTRSAFLRIFKICCAATAALAIIGYVIWRSLPYVQGPEISIYEPLDGGTVSSSTTMVSGRAERIKSITVNGFAISVDEDGNFRSVVVLFPGTNAITLRAADQFGRSVTNTLWVSRR